MGRPTSYLDALEAGRGILKDSADDVRATLAGLSPSEREAYVTGAKGRLHALSQQRMFSAPLTNLANFFRA